MTISRLRGKTTSMDLRLCSRAPRMTMALSGGIVLLDYTRCQALSKAAKVPGTSDENRRAPADASKRRVRDGALRVTHDLPPLAAALATSRHLGPRDVPLPIHKVQVAALLLDADLEIGR